MDKKFKRIFFYICLGGGFLFGLIFFIIMGHDLGYSWQIALLCFGGGLIWALLFYYIFGFFQGFNKKITYENKKAQKQLQEAEENYNLTYDYKFYGYVFFGKGLGQAICESTVYFLKDQIFIVFVYFKKIKTLTLPDEHLIKTRIDEDLLFMSFDTGEQLVVKMKFDEDTTKDRLKFVLTEKQYHLEEEKI